MNRRHSINMRRPAFLYLALSLLLGQNVSLLAYAQGLSSEADNSSLLPPEVVPLDPAVATSMSIAQTQQRESDMTIDQNSSVPGLVDNQVSGMQTAQEFRKAAFASLYGQGQPSGQLQEPQQLGGGQIEGGYGYPQANYQGNPYLANNNYPRAPVPSVQSQTLTAGVKHKKVLRDIRRAGFSNLLSAIAGFGAGAVTSAALLRPQYPVYGLGFYGLTMTGFGVRNAFRF